MATNLLTHKESALSKQSKFTIVTQECFGRLYNTSEFVSETKKVTILNEFMRDLQQSGYNENDRKNILQGGVSTYSKLKEKETRGIRPFYRPPGYRKADRNEAKIRKSKEWYKCKNSGDEFMAVMFVEATPEDRLLKMLKETEHKYRISDKHRINFVT